VDLGVTLPGTIRPLTLEYKDSIKDVILRQIMSHDRTFTEWAHFIHEMNMPIHPNISILCPFHPFFNSVVLNGEMIKEFFYKNMRLRWLAWKFIARLRKRIMDKRRIGELDLYTTLPIPVSHQVLVYDIKTRSSYIFHTHTAYKLLLVPLKYSSYGIASPQEPKNPYTNIPWNIAQNMTILSQIITNMVQFHHMALPIFFKWRASRYTVDTFYIANNMILNIEAAKSLFKEMVDRDAVEIYMETIEDLYSLNSDLRKMNYNLLKRLLKRRSIPKELLKRWDIHVTSFFIYSNHRFLYHYESIEDLLATSISLHMETLAWWSKRCLRQETNPVNTMLTM